MADPQQFTAEPIPTFGDIPADPEAIAGSAQFGRGVIKNVGETIAAPFVGVNPHTAAARNNTYAQAVRKATTPQNEGEQVGYHTATALQVLAAAPELAHLPTGTIKGIAQRLGSVFEKEPVAGVKAADIEAAFAKPRNPVIESAVTGKTKYAPHATQGLEQTGVPEQFKTPGTMAGQGSKMSAGPGKTTAYSEEALYKAHQAQEQADILERSMRGMRKPKGKQ